MSDYRYIGHDRGVHDAAAKAAGSLRYCADRQPAGELYMKLLLSPIAHGEIIAFDDSRARALSGVVDVLHWQNTPQKPYNRGRVLAHSADVDQETLFSRHPRFVGDRVAAVIAESEQIARDALELIEVEYREYAAALDCDTALRHPEYAIHERDAVVECGPQGYGDYEAAAGIELSVQTTMQRISHIAMETHCVLADYQRETDELTIWTPTQTVFGVRATVATLLEMPLSRVRVIKTAMGGSFGCKQEMILEPLAACAARRLARPVRLGFDRRETMLCTMLKHPVQAICRGKFSADGRINALDVDCVLDAGAYQSVSPGYIRAMYRKLSRVYDIADLRYRARSVCTNTPVSGSYRGWSSPESTLIVENLINQAARRLHIDPLELRLRNVLPPQGVSATENISLGNSRLPDVLEQGGAAFGWEQRRRELAAQDKNARYRRGVGMAAASHYCGFYPRKAESAALTIKLEEDGSLTVNACLHDHGCGTVSAFRAIIAEVLSVEPELIHIAEADTAHNIYDFGCFSSRTVYVIGRAAEQCAIQLREQLARAAAALLDCEPRQLRCADGGFRHTQDASRSVSYRRIAEAVIDRGEEALFAAYNHVPHSNPGVGAAHFAEVEVDTYTGLSRVTDYLAVHDIGRALQPELCRAQLGGALQQGIGFTFCEELKIERMSGRALNADLQHYSVARIFDMPPFEVLFVEAGGDEGPFGAKSFGEIAFVPVAPALLAAVNDALDTELASLPLDPPRLLAALKRRDEAKA